jgi:hypothetical protein
MLNTEGNSVNYRKICDENNKKALFFYKIATVT